MDWMGVYTLAHPPLSVSIIVVNLTYFTEVLSIVGAAYYHAVLN